MLPDHGPDWCAHAFIEQLPRYKNGSTDGASYEELLLTLQLCECAGAFHNNRMPCEGSVSRFIQAELP